MGVAINNANKAKFKKFNANLSQHTGELRTALGTAETLLSSGNITYFRNKYQAGNKYINATTSVIENLQRLDKDLTKLVSAGNKVVQK